MAVRIRVIAVGLLLGLWLIPAAPVAAAIQPQLIESKAYVGFPQTIDFYLEAQSDEDIVDVRLMYHVERESFAEIFNETFINIAHPDTGVDLSWTWNLRTVGGLPPGTELSYWWRITDDGGDVLETEPQYLVVADANRNWQMITKGQITLLWYEGGQDFAAELMEAAQDGLAQLREDTGTSLREPVEIYIYTVDDVHQVLLSAQEWTGGQAFPRYDKIVIGVEPFILDWGKRTVVHELTHLVTHQMTYNPYGDLPTWLNEGLSMYAEGDLEPEFKTYFNEAKANDSLLSVRSLASPFSSFGEISYVSYAESYEIVKYLIDEYGRDKMFSLLDIFKEGSTGDEALLAVYGFDMDGLNGLWMDYVYNPPPSDPLDQVEFSPALIILLVLVAATLAVSGLWLWRVRH